MKILIEIPQETYEYWLERHGKEEYVISEALEDGKILPDNLSINDILNAISKVVK